MQIIKYEINKTILTVGFKENNFVVYSQIAYDPAKLKQELLQKAYTQCRDTIEYEKIQTTHSIMSDLTGDVFTPDSPKASTITLTADKSSIQFTENQAADTVNLTAVARDQYGNAYPCIINYSTDYGTINGNTLTVPSVTEAKEVTVTASVGSITSSVKINRSPALITQTLSQVQQAKIVKINDAFANALNTKFPSSATGTELTYDYSIESQMSFSKLAISMIAGLSTYPEEIMLADQVTYVDHDQAQCQSLLMDIAKFEGPIRAKKKELLKAVGAATTIDDVNKIVVTF